MEIIVPTLVNIKKSYLTQHGIKDYIEWSKQENVLYIGRKMMIGGKNGCIHIPQSKWHNPFKLNVTKTNLDEVIEQYEDHIRNSSLYNELYELSGKEIGCWCKGIHKCHGDILIKLFKEKYFV